MLQGWVVVCFIFVSSVPFFFWVTSSGFACVDSEFRGGGAMKPPHSDIALTLCTRVLNA